MRRFVSLVGLGLLCCIASCSHDGHGRSVPPPSPPAKVALLAWNDLGMHCYNPDFQDLAVLPPFNTLWAQVVRIGDPPQVLTSGITVRYRVVNNTSSVHKTNFWTYAQRIFDLPDPLPPDVGLKGKRLAGAMDPAGDHFIAEGIPLTEYCDNALTTPNPYQLAVVTAEDSTTGEVLATSTIVVPVSSELHCDHCHMDDGDATTRYPIAPTGKVETNILTLHDFLNSGKYPVPLMASRPVLCAGCHSSNALGAAGQPGSSSLSNAMHHHHQDLSDITPDTNGCYSCHPGPDTQCLRCTMSHSYGVNCVNCHGTMAEVAQNTDPWLNEPRCDSNSCHGSAYALDQPLYRHSKGHGGAYCPACHNSPHAISPSRRAEDDIKFVVLQGVAGTLKKCTVCHSTEPTAIFRHAAPAP